MFRRMRWLVSSKTRILLLFVLVAALSVSSVVAYDYLSNDPKFCSSCHLMSEAYESWQHSAMHDINCHKCHETTLTAGMDHLLEVVFSNPQEVTKQAEVDNEMCTSCHASDDPAWAQVASTIGHRIHFFGNYENNCTSCHGLELHVFTPSSDLCKKCHTEIVTSNPQMELHCIQCHQFLSSEQTLLPEKRECLGCHEARETTTLSFPDGAHSGDKCTTCHEPHVQPEALSCTTCHDVSGEGLHLTRGHADCTSCHFPHSKAEMREQCISCHFDREDHFAPQECSVCHAFRKP